ncbi:MAG: 50S ribosomal protein L35 [Fusobacteriota bacterium]
MGKMKSHSGAKKRFKKTKKGKYKAKKAGKQHILTKKSSDKKRKMRNDMVIEGTRAKKLEQLLPNS